MPALRLGSAGETAFHLRARVGRRPFRPVASMHRKSKRLWRLRLNSGKNGANLFEFMTHFVFCAVFPFDPTEHVWFSPQPCKEMRDHPPKKSFDIVMAVIAILALIGFVVGLFKIMG